MAVLESCPKHNMVAYLEKTDGNTEFHEIISFLTRSSIHYALTVSPVVSTTFVEQFWMSAKSKIINNVRYITAKVAGKPVSISEASIRSDLLFDDADGIDSLPNQAIFDAIQLMGYEGDLTVLTFNKALFSPQWRFLFHTMNHCISSKSTSWDQIPTNIATAVICLTTNQKYNFSKLIFDGMMRHLDAKKKFVMYPRFISVFLDTQLKNVPVPLDHFPINALTSKVFSFMVKKGKHFSGNVTPLFDSMLVQPTEDEGDTLERQSEPQPIPSPPHLSEDQHETQTDPSPRPSPTTHIPDSIPEGSGGNHGGQSSSDRSLSGNEGGMTLQSVYDLCISLCTQVTDQAKEIKHLKAQIKKLKKKAKPVITHHKAWMKSVSMKQRLAGKKSLKKQWMQKESVSKQGRKPAKAEPTVHKDPAFDELDDDTMDYMETEDAQDVGRTSYVVHEEKESAEKGVSTEDPLSTAQPKVSTDKPEDSTDKPDEGTDKPKVSTDKEEVSTDRPDEGTVDQNEGRSATQTAPTTTTPTIFGDDETIAQVLIIMSQNKEKLKEKEKGVELKDVEETERPRPTSTRSLLTLKPLPKIDPKDKGKKMIEEEDESDTDSEDITEAEKKFKQLARDEEVARKVQEDWEAEEEVKKLAEEEATKAAFSNEYDFIQARLNADKILAEKLQEEEREMYTIEQRAKLLHDTIAAQRRFLAQQRSEAIRNKPPSRNQLRNQMMTYLKHVGGKKHSDLKTKTFEEIQVLYERLKRQDQNFVAIGSAEDERQIKELNKDPEKKKLKKRVVNEEDTAKVPAEQEVTEQGTKKRKSGHVKMIARKRPRPQPDNDSDDEYRKCLRIITFESTIDSEIMETKSFIARVHKVSSPDGNYLVVYRVNGHFRAFNYLMEVLHIFDRQDLFHLYDLVMKQYSEITPEDIELILWGDLKIMMESSTEENVQEFKDGTVIYMLVERRYPLSKELLQQMLDLGLEVEEESTAALQLDQTVSELAIPDQTATGKGIPNPLMAGRKIYIQRGLQVETEDVKLTTWRLRMLKMWGGQDMWCMKRKKVQKRKLVEVIRILAGQILIFAAMAGYPNVTAFCMNELLLLQLLLMIHLCSDLSVHKLKVRETCTVANVYVDVALWLAYYFGLCFFDATDTFVAAIHGVPVLWRDDSDGGVVCDEVVTQKGDDDNYVVRFIPGSVTYVQTVLGRAGYDPENEEVKSGMVGVENMHKGNKYVLFLDDDVRLHPRSVGALTTEMMKNRVNVLWVVLGGVSMCCYEAVLTGIVAGNKMVGQNVTNALTYVKGGMERRCEMCLFKANDYVGNVAAKQDRVRELNHATLDEEVIYRFSANSKSYEVLPLSLSGIHLRNSLSIIFRFRVSLIRFTFGFAAALLEENGKFLLSVVCSKKFTMLPGLHWVAEAMEMMLLSFVAPAIQPD
ncbi:hypothetical protein Tco_0769025 [Tanacetum coccineum]|uniref:Ceramide glucosyltransferase n=1 Tax=Tanacetum coccineum TaxID=301880 RepID=A0ABQ4Z8A8_9ASTR